MRPFFLLDALPPAGNVDIGFKANIGNAALTELIISITVTPLTTTTYPSPGFYTAGPVFQNGVQQKDNNTYCRALFYENRWGGELQWEKYCSGTDVYGEKAFYTKRWELLVLMHSIKKKNVVFFSFLIRTMTYEW
jgi:outer membrane receptor for ferrienterochelin and colicins